MREGDERVLDVLERLQHHALVRREQLLLRRRLERDVGPDAPALEDRPGDARCEGEEPALPVEEVRAADALQAGCPRDEEARKEVAPGDADLGRLRRELPFRPGDVRPAEQELGRETDGDLRGRLRNRPHGRELLLERHRRLPEEDAQNVHRLRGLLVEQRDRRGGGGDLGCGALDVDLRREARIEEPPGQVERPLLRREVLVRQGDSLLQATIGDVLEADLAHQGDEHRIPVVLRCLDARVGGFHCPAVPTEDIHLPVRVEARLEEIEHSSRAPYAQAVLARSLAGVGPRRLDLRPEVGRRNPARRAGLAHPGLGLLKSEVRLHRALDDRRQELVIEGGPPCRRGAVRDGVTAPRWRCRRRELTPGRRRDDVRTAVVRPDHATGCAEEDRNEGRRAARHGLAAPVVVFAGFAMSTRLPSAMFAASPVASTSVVSTPESTSTSFPKSRPIWIDR